MHIAIHKVKDCKCRASQRANVLSKVATEWLGSHLNPLSSDCVAKIPPLLHSALMLNT